VVAGLTGGIFDPMSIKATCASGGRAAAPGSPEIKVGEARRAKRSSMCSSAPAVCRWRAA